MHPLRPLQTLFSPSREPVMERRLFQMVCLAACVLTLGVVIPVNVVQNLPWILNAYLAAFGVLSLALYLLSRRGTDLVRTFAVAVAVVLNLSWFADAGSQGSMGMFFFAGVMVNIIFFRGRRRRFFLLAFALNGIALITVDHLHPEWSIPFHTPLDRYLDLVTGFLVSVTACVLMIWVVTTSHDEERRRLGEANAELKRNLEEIRTLQGLLPICSWCKKVRDDAGLWTQVEHYLADHTDLSFTHGMCPECAQEHFPKGKGPVQEPRSPGSP